MKRLQQGGQGGPPPPKTPGVYPEWTGLSRLMKELFSGYGLGGFSQVVQFASLGGRTTPLQLMNVLQFGNDVEFAQAISRSPELKRMYQSALKSGLNKQQARHAVHAELAKRLGMKPPKVSVDLDRLNSLDLSE